MTILRLNIFETIELRRAERAAKRMLRKIGTPDALAILENDEMLEEFMDEAISQQSRQTRGAFADIIQALIKSFTENPEAWIKIISAIIAMFA